MTIHTPRTPPDKPLFLYISSVRLVLLSILSMGLYECYWMYKNWRCIKDRYGLDIMPFWRGIFGFLFCHALLRRIHEDREARSVRRPTFPPTLLATAWLVLSILARLVSHGMFISGAFIFHAVISVLIPTFLCLVPVQDYVNAVTEKRDPGSAPYPWSVGHVICIAVGLVEWASLFIRFGSPPI